MSIFAAVKASSPTMKTILVAVVVLLVCVVLMGVKVLFVKGGRFPDGHISHSPELRRRGISCAGHDDEPDHNTRKPTI